MVRKVILSLLAVVVAAFAAHAGSVHGQAPTASLTVTVGMRSPNGASSGLASGPTATLPITPVGGVEVLAMTPGGSADSPAASAITDGDGNATLDLTPGTYWVFVARADPPGSGPLGTVLTRSLPDGTLTPVWAEVDLSDGNPAAITLTATQLNP